MSVSLRLVLVACAAALVLLASTAAGQVCKVPIGTPDSGREGACVVGMCSTYLRPYEVAECRTGSGCCPGVKNTPRAPGPEGRACTIVAGTFFSSQKASCTKSKCKDAQGEFPSFAVATGTPDCPEGQGCCPGAGAVPGVKMNKPSPFAAKMSNAGVAGLKRAPLNIGQRVAPTGRSALLGRPAPTKAGFRPLTLPPKVLAPQPAAPAAPAISPLVLQRARNQCIQFHCKDKATKCGTSYMCQVAQKECEKTVCEGAFNRGQMAPVY